MPRLQMRDLRIPVFLPRCSLLGRVACPSGAGGADTAGLS